jgi:integrase
VPDTIADMIRVQLFTGMRSGELVILCPGAIDRSDAVWLHRPRRHKTGYRDKERTIAIGPRAQAVLAKYLLRPDDAPCFTPRRRAIGSRCSTESYRRVIHRACEREGILILVMACASLRACPHPGRGKKDNV